MSDSLKILSASALMAGTFWAVALPAQAIDLLQAYRDALASDPVYASARYSRDAGEEKITQGRAGLLPQVGLSGNYTRNAADLDLGRTTSSSHTNSSGYTLSLTQPLLRWANWEGYEEGKLSAAASEAQFAQAQQDLIVRVAQAYFDVLASQDALASVQAQMTAITEQLASARRNFEIGTATITDTHEAQSRYDLALAQQAAATNDLAVKRAALEQVIGVAPGALSTLKAGLKLAPPEPARIDDWVGSAQSRNYGVTAQQLSLEIAQREIRRNQAGHAPTVDLVASRSHLNQNGPSLTIPTGVVADQTSIGVQWTIPLFSGFAVTSKVKESIALADKARADLENARRTAAQNARQAFLGVANGLAQVKALEAAEASSKLALESNQLGYEVGVRINIDVLNAQQQLYATRRDLAKARYDTLVNGLRLKAAASVLKEDDLAALNTLLQAGGAPSEPADTRR